MTDTQSGDDGHFRSEATQEALLFTELSVIFQCRMASADRFAGVELDAMRVVDEPVVAAVKEVVA